METTEKNWYVDIDGTVYEATTETIDQWIWDGTVLSKHQVSRGGNRWLEAGKVPRFTGHFENARQMQELMGEGVGVTARVMPPPVREEPQAPFISSASRPMPSEVAASAQSPFGIRLLGGSAVALLIALTAAYFWVYHISAPMDLALINNTREMQAVQTKFDQQKSQVEQARAEMEARPAPTVKRTAGGLGPAKTGDIASRKFGNFQMDMPVYTPPPPVEIDLEGIIPKRNFDGEIQNLTAEFETEKKVVIDNARSAERKSRFTQTLVLLFLGLAGLNLVRISIFQGKR